MGKPNPVLRILVHPSIFETKEVQEQLVSAGHEVTQSEDISTYDLVIGPNCWRMNGTLVKHLPLALKAARVGRKEAKKGAS